jgi:hypothetical protein
MQLLSILLLLVVLDQLGVAEVQVQEVIELPLDCQSQRQGIQLLLAVEGLVLTTQSIPVMA